MPLFRKKPVVIEARQFTGSWASAKPILAWMQACDPLDRSGGRWQDVDAGILYINTLEGEMVASPGDWIIKGVSNEFYPCKPYIFQQTYEAVEEH